MPTPRFSIRVDPPEVERWRTAATAEGLSISEWVRRRCSTDQPSTTPASPPKPTTPKRKPTPNPKPATADCVHPRGARVVLNGGLVRCGACGDLVR